MYVFLLLVLTINKCVSEYCPQTPCKPQDSKCLEVLFGGIFYDIINGIPALDIEPSDPIVIDVIEENLAFLELKSYDNYIQGLRNISITRVLCSDDLGFISFSINCPALIMNYTIDLNGYLLKLPVNDTKQGFRNIGEQSVKVYSTLHIINGTDNTPYLQLGNFSIEVSLDSGIILVNKGDNETIEEYNKTNEYLNKNGKELFSFAKNSLWYAILERILKNLNIYLASVPKNKIINCA